MHPATQNLIDAFDHYAVTEDGARDIAKCRNAYMEMARDLVAICGEGPETTAALRKLMESKDCAVRAIVARSR